MGLGKQPPINYSIPLIYIFLTIIAIIVLGVWTWVWFWLKRWSKRDAEDRRISIEAAEREAKQESSQTGQGKKGTGHKDLPNDSET